MKTTLTKLEILNETINFYSEDINRRAVNEDTACMYNTEDGRHCAVGRCLTQEIQEQGINFDCNTNSVYRLQTDYTLDNILQPQYKGHKTSFWTRLQNLHDESPNWNKEGLSSVGQLCVDRIKRDFNITE